MVDRDKEIERLGKYIIRRAGAFMTAGVLSATLCPVSPADAGRDDGGADDTGVGG